MPVPGLSGDAVAPALRPLGEARMLPAEAYTSQRVFAWEQRVLFAGSWTCVRRTRDMDSARQQGVRAGGVGVLLTREAGRVRAFANTCRHRGHELIADGHSHSRGTIVCPYHAWSYRLDGRLRSAPGFHDVAGFDAGQLGLVELPVAVWHGWVFVNASADGPAFVDHLGALDALVAPYTPERLVLGARHDYELVANWKTITENYHECYHCPLIHPELCQVSQPDSGRNYDLPGAWVGGDMALRDGMQTMSSDGRGLAPRIPGAPDGVVRYVGLLPNLLLSLHPDYVMTHRLEPLAADRTRVECSWYFARAGVDPAYAVEFWDLTNRQDWAACESVQRGLASGHYRPGPLAPNEDAVHRLIGIIARSYMAGVLYTPS